MADTKADKYSDKPSCPACGSEQVAAIRYGKQAMTPELEQALGRGDVVWGGCAQPDKLSWCCNACGKRWR